MRLGSGGLGSFLSRLGHGLIDTNRGIEPRARVDRYATYYVDESEGAPLDVDPLDPSPLRVRAELYDPVMGRVGRG